MQMVRTVGLDIAKSVFQVHGVIRYAKIHGTTHRPWLTALLARRPTKIAAIALANKNARIVWAMLASDKFYEPKLSVQAA